MSGASASDEGGSHLAAKDAAATPALACSDARVLVDGAVAIASLTLRSSGDRVLVAGDYLPLLRALTAGATATNEPGSARIGAGRIELGGKDVARGGHFAIAGFALADPPMPRTWTAAQYVVWSARLAAKPSREARALADAALVLAGAAPLRGRKLAMLDPAMRRVVSLAQAAATEPKVMVIEDPLRGLDERSSGPVLFALSAVTRGRAAIVCLPRLSVQGPEGELARTATHAFVLRRGELVLDADPAALWSGMTLFTLTVSRNAEALAEQLKQAGATVAGGPLHFSVALPASLTARDILSAAAVAKASVLSCLPLG